MKKVLKGTSSFRALGLKQQALALAVCFSFGVGAVSTVQAAPARNINPPTLQANAPNVYVVKKAIRCGIFQEVSAKPAALA